MFWDLHRILNLNFKVVFFLVSYTFTVLWSVIIIWGSADWIIRILVLKLQSESLDNNIMTSTCLASGQWGYIFRTGKIILTHDTFLVFLQSVLLLCPCVIQSKNYRYFIFCHCQSQVTGWFKTVARSITRDIIKSERPWHAGSSASNAMISNHWVRSKSASDNNGLQAADKCHQYLMLHLLDLVMQTIHRFHNHREGPYQDLLDL